MKHLVLFIIFIIISNYSKAQVDSCWTVLLKANNSKLEIKEDMYSFSRTGFFLRPNCVYEIYLQDGNFYNGRLIQVKKDSLLFSNYFNETMAAKAGKKLDTLSFHYSKLKKFQLIADRSLGIYTYKNLENFDFIFSLDTLDHRKNSIYTELYLNVDSLYELVPHFTLTGITLLYEESGRLYFYYGSGLIKGEEPEPDSTYYHEYGFALMPGHYDRFDGISLGLLTENWKNRELGLDDSLRMNGISIEINPFHLFTAFFPVFTIPHSNELSYYEEQIKNKIPTIINGINISALHKVSQASIRGANLAMSQTAVFEIKGLTVSGLSNFAFHQSGLSIASLYNKATELNGVQIGLVNKAVQSQGIQIGLWNVNEKRSWPFINWNFKKEG